MRAINCRMIVELETSPTKPCRHRNSLGTMKVELELRSRKIGLDYPDRHDPCDRQKVAARNNNLEKLPLNGRSSSACYGTRITKKDRSLIGNMTETRTKMAGAFSPQETKTKPLLSSINCSHLQESSALRQPFTMPLSLEMAVKPCGF